MEYEKLEKSMDAVNRKNSVNSNAGSHYEEFKHPNLEVSVNPEEDKPEMRYKKSKCKQMCKRFDVMIMKPIFIRKYKYSVAR